MYEFFQRVYTAVTSFPSLVWPWSKISTKRIRSSDDEDVIIVSPKKLKIHNTSMQAGVCHVKNSNTQTENIKRKQSINPQQWEFEQSAKENWDVPIEVIDLVEDTPNKFKNQYRPPRHVRSPHRIKKKSLLALRNYNDVNNSTNENKVLSKQRSSCKNSCRQFLTENNTNQKTRKNWSTNTKMSCSNNFSEADETFTNLQGSFLSPKVINSINHDEYSLLLNTFINKNDSETSVATVPSLASINIDLTNESSDDNASTSQSPKELKAPKRLTEGTYASLNKLGNSSVNVKTQPRRMRVKVSKTGVEAHNLRSPTIIIDDDDDDEDSVVFIKTPPVAKVNTLKNKIKAESIVADQQWVSDLVKNYEEKRSEMEEMIKKLTMELKIASENHRSNQNELTVKLLTRHLQVTESICEEEDIIEPALPSLTPEMKEVITKASRKHPADEVLIEKFNYRIKRNDIHTLTGLNWLNDEIINFYISLIMERSKEKPNLPKTYSFNTFFYLRLANSGYQGVKRWTKKVDIFAHDLIIIPVHLKMHWCLAAIDGVNKTINYYDSMGTTNDQCLKRLEEYLVSEHKDKKGENLSLENWTMTNVKDIPRQRNGSDCGVFSCTFAEFLSRRARFTFDQNDMPLVRNKMIYEIVSGKLLT